MDPPQAKAGSASARSAIGKRAITAPRTCRSPRTGGDAVAAGVTATIQPKTGYRIIGPNAQAIQLLDLIRRGGRRRRSLELGSTCSWQYFDNRPRLVAGGGWTQ